MTDIFTEKDIKDSTYESRHSDIFVQSSNDEVDLTDFEETWSHSQSRTSDDGSQN